jgi:integrase
VCPRCAPEGSADISTEKLTDHRVKHVAAPAEGRIELWDSVLPGLGLRVAAASSKHQIGIKTWFVRYRTAGTQRRLKLGTYPTLGLAEARNVARQIFTEVGNGGDPSEQKRERASRAKAEAFDRVAELFVTRYAKQKNRSWQETERILKRYVTPVWGSRPIREITRRDVIELLDDMVDRGAPVMAKQTHATVRKLFYWAVDRDILETSPCVRVPVPARAAERDRVLTESELRSVWLACEALKWPFGPLVRLLMLTGQRRDEVATMRWPDVNLDAALWTIPRELTKSDRAHEVPLSTLAREIIGSLPKVDQSLVFTTNGKVAVAGFSNAKRRLDHLSGIGDWHLHDLRRTAASGMARLGVAPHVVEKVLAHKTGTISGVAAIYNRHGYLAEKRDALERWAREVFRVAEDGQEEPQVIAISRVRKP